MKTINALLLYLLVFIFASCSSNDDEDNSDQSRIDVTINGADYTFNTITVEKHFQGTENDDEFPDWFEVHAKIDNELDLIINFDVEVGYTGYWDEGTIIGEFNLLSNNNENSCVYNGVNIQHPQIDVTVNNKEEFIASFSFTNNYGGNCGTNSTFGDEVTYTNGLIYIKL